MPRLNRSATTGRSSQQASSKLKSSAKTVSQLSGGSLLGKATGTTLEQTRSSEWKEKLLREPFQRASCADSVLALFQHAPEDWESDQVVKWIISRGFVPEARLFQLQPEIDGEILMRMRENDLVTLGVSSVGRRMRLWDEMQSLKRVSRKPETALLPAGISYFRALTELFTFRCELCMFITAGPRKKL